MAQNLIWVVLSYTYTEKDEIKQNKNLSKHSTTSLFVNMAWTLKPIDRRYYCIMSQAEISTRSGSTTLMEWKAQALFISFWVIVWVSCYFHHTNCNAQFSHTTSVCVLENQETRHPRQATTDTQVHQENYNETDNFRSKNRLPVIERLFKTSLTMKRDVVKQDQTPVKIVKGSASIPEGAGVQSIGIPPLFTLNANLSEIPVPIPNTSIVHYSKINTFVHAPWLIIFPFPSLSKMNLINL